MRGKILIVEDEVLVRSASVAEFKELGYEVLEADNADEAIALLEKHSDVVLVFTDVNMPGTMNGLMLAQAVAKRWPPVKLVVTSGLPLQGKLPVGAKFLSKPYRSHNAHEVFQSMFS